MESLAEDVVLVAFIEAQRLIQTRSSAGASAEAGADWLSPHARSNPLAHRRVFSISPPSTSSRHQSSIEPDPWSDQSSRYCSTHRLQYFEFRRALSRVPR